MAIVDGSLQLGYKDSAWFTSNASVVLLVGQIVYLEQTGTYKIGNGVTALSALSFLGGGGSQSLQDVVTVSPTLEGVLAESLNNETSFYIENGNATMASSGGDYVANTVVSPTVIETSVLGLATQSYHYVSDTGIENTTPLLTYNSVEVETKPTQKTGTALTFDVNAAYGTIGTPETGNITFSTTGAKLMSTVLVIHNHTSAPTFAANMRETNVSKGYSTGVINYILVTYINSTEVIYTIFQRA